MTRNPFLRGAKSVGRLFFLLSALTQASYANLPVKRGTSMCQFDDCSLQTIPRFGQGASASGGSHTVGSLSEVGNKTSETHKKMAVVVRKKKLARHDGTAPDSLRMSQAQAIEGSLPQLVGKASFLPLSGGGSGNLPVVYHAVNWKDFEASDQTVMLTPQLGAKLKGVRVGDALSAVIEDEIEVWSGVSSPVRAFVIRGLYRGATISGQATLDPSRKKIMIAFDKLRLAGGGDVVYSLKAQVRTVTGRNGLDGNYHSESGKFFLGEMLASTAAGFTDASIQRTQNLQGNYVQEPSLSNAAKNGLGVALTHRAERFAQQEGQAPEWTELDGYQEVQIYVLADPTEDST